MKIFVSHSHQDSDSAKALVDMLLANISVDDQDIRCTSVPDHTLRFGKSIAQLLKEDINIAPALIALISKQSLKSNWVMFELGAAWGLGKDIYPIIGPGVNIQDLPGPLGTLSCIVIESADSASRIAELIKQIFEDFSLQFKSGGKAQASLVEFLRQYSSDTKGPKTKTDNNPENQEDAVLSAIWKMDESEYDQHGYSVEKISQKTASAIPKCEHILSGLVKKDFLEKRHVYGGKYNENRYRFKDASRNHLIQNNLV